MKVQFLVYLDVQNVCTLKKGSEVMSDVMYLISKLANQQNTRMTMLMFMIKGQEKIPRFMHFFQWF